MGKGALRPENSSCNNVRHTINCPAWLSASDGDDHQENGDDDDERHQQHHHHRRHHGTTGAIMTVMPIIIILGMPTRGLSELCRQDLVVHTLDQLLQMAF
jgi:hypothetical protein